MASSSVADNVAAVTFPLIPDVASYVPNTFDYYSNTNGVVFADWIEVFRKSIPSYKKHALQDTTVPEQEREARTEQFAQDFNSLLDALLANPIGQVEGYGVQPVTCISLCAARDVCLKNLGFGDIFKTVKEKENEQALQLLPGVLKELNSITDTRARLDLAVRGVFSGNIFDLGAAASANLPNAGTSSFCTTREKLLSRPWVIDHLDALLDRLTSHKYRKVLMFVDNAGPDVLLGMLPLAVELVKLGSSVLVAANSVPSINDITAGELQPLLKAAAAAQYDPLLTRAVLEGLISVVPSGNDLGVIDLRKVSSELVTAAEGVDLLILEGMGRSIETNLNVVFACDSVKLGMIKHPEVATCLNGRLYDCVCKFDPAA